MRNDYECPNHGVMEIYFEGEPPTLCPDCEARLTFLIAPNQFTLGGDMTVLDEATRRGVQQQLGVRVETRDELRALERKKGVTRIGSHELKNMDDSQRWSPPKPPDIGAAMAAARKEGTYPTR